MHLARPLAALALVPALAGLAAAQAPDFDRAALDRRMAELRPAIEAELGRPFAAELRVLPSTRKELARIVAKENAAILTELEGGPRGAELVRQCEAEAEAMSGLCFGKIDLEQRAVRVVPDTFGRFASIAPEWSGVRTQAFLDIVVIHEAVHVAQDEQTSMLEFIGKPRSVEELRARFAVIEGHAQWITRRVADRLGLGEAHRLFESTISTVPAGAAVDPAVRMLLEAQTANASFQYVEGERFFAALVTALGSPAAALERAWARPPRTFREVSRPAEYLEPPAAPAFDVKAIAQANIELMPEGWRNAVVPLPEPTLRSVFQPGGEAIVARAMAAYEDGAVTVAGSPAGEQLTIAVMRATSPEGATDLLACEEAVARAKDEQFKGDNGAFKITSAVYSAPELVLEGEEKLVGMLMVKQLEAQGQTIHATTLVISRGALLIEVSRVGMTPVAEAELMTLARGVFERAAKVAGGN